MYWAYKVLAVVWSCSLLTTGNDDPKGSINDSEAGGNNSLLTASVYAKLFAERRREHQLMIRSILALENYEKKFKLLQIAYGKIFEVIAEKNATLASYGYEASRDGFPQNSKLQDAVTLTLENCCFAAESLLHFPEISRRIFGKKSFSLWKSTLSWCNDFVNSLTHLIDESTVKLMDLLLQEINEDQRTSNYVNPYYEASGKQPKKLKKQYKKLKKGPSLGGKKTEL